MACRADLLRALLIAALAGLVPRAEAGVRAPFPVAARARIDLRLVTADGTAPWAWDAQSRSPLDGSRFMVDLTAGEARTGTLYLKGASRWEDSDGRSVTFGLEQGDYHYRLGEDSAPSLEVLAFGDERRFFTGELGVVTLSDDRVERFQHRLGLSLGATRDALGAGYLISRLDEGESSRVLQRVAFSVASMPAYGALSYRHVDAPAGANHALAQAEAAAHYRRATAIVSYALSGIGDGVFFPSGSFDTDALDSSHYIAAAPQNSATSGELRLRRAAVAGDVVVDALYRYEGIGTEYSNDLAEARRGTVSNAVVLDASHRRFALDGRLLFRDEVRSGAEDSWRRGVEALARAFLHDNSQVLVRGGWERREYRGDEENDEGFVEGGYRRELQRFMGGVSVRLDGIGNDTNVIAAVESRLNWSPTGALYARWIVDDEGAGPGSVFARLEFRPSARAWVTLAYGRDDIGAGPYPLDALDTDAPAPSNDVVTLTVRGDF